MLRLAITFFLGVMLSACCDEDFIIPSQPTGPANDLRVNAIDVTSLFDVIPNCSTDPIYTTMGATADGGIGSCWLDQRNAGDVWFKFTSQEPFGYFSISINTGDTEGTQQFSQYMLYDTDGITEVGCDGYDANSEDFWDFNDLEEIGQVYYFSVSVPADSYKGTFSMCLTTSD